ncbi:MAG: S8 family serine peptidase [Pseudomonadota bacterium]
MTRWLLVIAWTLFATPAFAETAGQAAERLERQSVAGQDGKGGPVELTSLGALHIAGTDNPATRKVYIVQLEAPSAADFHAEMVKTAIRPGDAKPKMDRQNPLIANYAASLLKAQDTMLAKAGPNVELVYRYQYGLNGFAARMSPAQAQKLVNQRGVLRVWEDEVRPLATNESLDFLGLFDRDSGLRSGQDLDGDGIVIGVIDSGIAPEHPALQDTRPADRPSLCKGDWAENTFLGRWLCRRFEKREDEILFEAPEDWNGICETGERFEAADCNNKLIGARYFITGAEQTGPIDEDEIRSARDVDGHGTHVATTAAGNKVKASIFTRFIGRIDGVAPRARIAAYKACWLRPGDTRASCNTSDLANAIDAAVADGVDVINYSIGSSLLRDTAPDAIALLAATKAGVFTVVAAGNEGPAFGTVFSPAGSPWIATAGASTRDGEAFFEAFEVRTPSTLAGLYAVREANFTPPLADVDPLEGRLVLVDDDIDQFPGGGSGTTSDACEALVNSTDVSGQIAFIQRGGCPFEDKIQNAENAGAIAVVVYNIAGDPIVMNGTSGIVTIPALMMGQADGNLILAEFDAGNEVQVTLDRELFLSEADTGNRMGDFSSRGPGQFLDILKPDVTAPGVNILAGYTPDAVNATPGENFAYLSGTSMSTPHVAGVAALLLEANPDWSPSAVKSALMTTARQNITLSDGETAANPFHYGAGHIVPNDAIDPGLIYDVTDDEFDAFTCGVNNAIVGQQRCDDLAIAGLSFEGPDLNQPSIAVGRMIASRTVTRRVTNVSEQAATYTANVVAPVGIGVNVTPSTLSLAPGESANFDVAFTYQSDQLDLWRFGSLTWESNTHSVRSPLAVRPISIDVPAEIQATGAMGNFTFPVTFGYDGTYTTNVSGLALPFVINGFVENDPTKTFTFRDFNGVRQYFIDVEPGDLYLRFSLFDALTDGNDDLDLYLFYCGTGNSCVQVGASGNATSDEEINVLQPPVGRYVISVHGFETDQVAGGQGSNFTLLTWKFGEVDDRGNLTVNAPGSVTANSTENIDIDWTGLINNTVYLGGIQHITQGELSALTIVRVVVAE